MVLWPPAGRGAGRCAGTKDHASTVMQTMSGAQSLLCAACGHVFLHVCVRRPWLLPTTMTDTPAVAELPVTIIQTNTVRIYLGSFCCSAFCCLLGGCPSNCSTHTSCANPGGPCGTSTCAFVGSANCQQSQQPVVAVDLGIKPGMDCGDWDGDKHPYVNECRPPKLHCPAAATVICTCWVRFGETAQAVLTDAINTSCACL